MNGWPSTVTNFTRPLTSLAVDFFNQINLLYGSITEFCTPKTCDVMCAGPKYVKLIRVADFLVRYEYLWADGETIKRPIKVSAPEYVDYLMTWVQSILDDESIFPSRVGNFKGFESSLFCQMYRFQRTSVIL
jgi:MOB kinase activator 1